MPKIFLSYRRSDTQGEAGHLLAELRQRYGAASVFMDISTIEPGADFPQTIEQAMIESAIVLVLIGRDWLDSRDGSSQRRLDDPRDWVRLEVELALANGRRLIPVLVQGAQMPREEALPESLRALARLNAHEISARRWDYDFQALASVLDRLLPDAAPPGRTSVTPQTPKSSRHLWTAGGTALFLLAVIGGGFLLRGEQSTPNSFDRSPAYIEFVRTGDKVSALPAPGDRELRAFERARQAACIGFDITCERATVPKVTSTWEAICQRRLSRSTSSTVALQYLIFLYSPDVLKAARPEGDLAPTSDAAWEKCLHDLSAAMFMERHERTNDEIRSIGAK